MRESKTKGQVARIFLVLVFTLILSPISVFAANPDEIVNAGQEVPLSASATDMDCYYPNQGCPYEKPDTAITITWSAVWKDTTTPAGSFKNGDNEGTSVTWIAPCTSGDVTITATADNSQSTKAIDSSESDGIWVQVNLLNFNITAIEVSDGTGPGSTTPASP